MLIPIKEWAERNGLTKTNALNMARQGRLGRAARLILRDDHRWMVEDDKKPPQKNK